MSESESESEIVGQVQRFINRKEKSDTYLLQKFHTERRAKRFVRKSNSVAQAQLLSAALDQEDLIAFDNLLKHGVSPNVKYMGYTVRVENRDGENFNILRRAINQKRADYVRSLVREGVNVNAVTDNLGEIGYWPAASVIKNTNIHRAVELEHVQMVKILIDARADLTIRSKFKSLPIHTGLKNNSSRVRKTHQPSIFQRYQPRI